MKKQKKYEKTKKNKKQKTKKQKNKKQKTKNKKRTTNSQHRFSCLFCRHPLHQSLTIVLSSTTSNVSK